MTPTRKGLYLFCNDCIFKIHNNDLKYPCLKSHKEVRKSDNVILERDFKICKLKETFILKN